ncbi:hypothetical protein QW180_26750 [Vibrio sinaloensis]|nr:hypothetical protein [Vibrio sinaloensis]
MGMAWSSEINSTESDLSVYSVAAEQYIFFALTSTLNYSTINSPNG